MPQSKQIKPVLKNLQRSINCLFIIVKLIFMNRKLHLTIKTNKNIQMTPVAPFSFLRKLSFVLSLIVLTLVGQKAYSQQVITIQQAVDNALKNNLTVKQAEFSAALTNEDLIQSKNALLPTVSASVNPNLTFGRGLDQTTFQVTNQTSLYTSASLSTSVDLFQGLSKINQIKQIRLFLEADKTNIDKIKNDLILQVVTAYMQILFNKDLLKTSQEQLTVAKQTANREQALLDAGNKTLADVSQAKSQVATAELGVTNAQNALSISYLVLNQLMEMPSNNQFDVQAPLVSIDGTVSGSLNAADVFNNALNTFPDIKMYNLRSLAAKQQIDIARASYYPRLSLGAGVNSSYSYQFNYNGLTPQQAFSDQINQRFGQSIGMNLQIPIFNGYSARWGVRRAKISYQNALVTEQLVKNNLNKVVSQAILDLRAAESRYVSTQNAFNAQKDAYYVVEQRYNVGLVNSLDFSTAQTNRNKAEIDMIQAKYDLIFRAKVIDYYLGKQITF
jgi:outer membrane protein